MTAMPMNSESKASDSLPDYWKEPEPTGLGLMWWTWLSLGAVVLLKVAAIEWTVWCHQ